jgi:thiamine kinase-like enzyme
MISQWKDILRENASRWKLPMGGEWSFLMSNVTHSMGCTIYLLWFHDGDTYPRAVAKLSRQESFLRTEFQNLLAAHACAPVWTPRPFDLSQEGEVWMLWMEGMPGSKCLSKQSNSSALKPVVEMLGDIHKTIRDRGNWPSEDRYRRAVLEPIESVEQFSNDRVIIAGCAELRAKISAEWICSLPVIPQHCDFFPGNLLKHKNQFHLVDWEYFGRVDLPLFDLLTLLCFVLRTGTENLEDWDSSLVKSIPSLTDSYGRKIGLSPEDAAKLVPIVLVNWAHLHQQEKHAAESWRVYRTLRHYFEHQDLWQGLFVPAGSRH